MSEIRLLVNPNLDYNIKLASYCSEFWYDLPKPGAADKKSNPCDGWDASPRASNSRPSYGNQSDKVPSNVTIYQSAPHRIIFPSASALITHAGHGTVIRALASGVPLICIPIGRDQPGNAPRAVSHEAGLRLPVNARSEDISRAIQKMFDEPKYLENARRLGHIISEEARNATGVQELERAAKFKLSIYGET